jgi:hypothetical protein
MRPTFLRARRPLPLVLCATAALGLGLAGCADVDPPGTSDDAPLPEGTALVAEFVLHVYPSEHRVVLERIDHNEEGNVPARGPGLGTQSIDTLNLVQDGAVGGPANSVELVTNSVGEDAACPSVSGTPQSELFCGNVTLNSYYTRTLSNTFVQVTSIVDDNGVDVSSTHGVLNSDSSQYFSAQKGMWQYTATGASKLGVLGTSPNNSDDRDWVFHDPDGINTHVNLRVLSTLTYASYTQALSFRSFVDACSGGTNLGKPSGTVTLTLPFKFTLYGTTATTVSFNKFGNVTFNGTAPDASGNNVQLPKSNAPKPAVFPFWDVLDFGTAATSKLCHRTIGVAPARRFVVTWTDMNFGNGVSNLDKPSHMTFSMALDEGIDEIDFNYNSMTGPSGRTRFKGSSASIGVQNETGTVGTGTFNNGQYASNTAWTFSPTP